MLHFLQAKKAVTARCTKLSRNRRRKEGQCRQKASQVGVICGVFAPPLSSVLPRCTSFRATHPRTRPVGDGSRPALGGPSGDSPGETDEGISSGRTACGEFLGHIHPSQLPEGNEPRKKLLEGGMLTVPPWSQQIDCNHQ